MATRRFIAGAVCPKCSEMDKTVMYQESGKTIRECVRCGFQDIMAEDSVEEPVTRVNQPRPGEAPLSHEDEIQIVNLMDPRDGKSRRDH